MKRAAMSGLLIVVASAPSAVGATATDPSAVGRAEMTGATVAPQPQQDQVDINKATAQELESVPGIGPAIASRIVEFRQEHGPFEVVDDLLNVRGIGETTLEKLRPYLKVEETRPA